MLISIDISSMVSKMRRIEVPDSGLWKQAQWFRIAFDLAHIFLILSALRRKTRRVILKIRESISGNIKSDFYDLISFCDLIPDEQGALMYADFKSILDVANTGLDISGKLKLRFDDMTLKHSNTPRPIRFLEQKIRKYAALLEDDYDELQMVAESIVAAVGEKISSPAA